MNESDYSRKLRKALEARGAWCRKLSDRFHACYPDLIGTYQSFAFAIESKVFPNKLTAGQELELTQFAQAGGVALVCIFNKTTKRITMIDWTTGSRSEHTDIEDAVTWLLSRLFLNTSTKQ